VPTKTPLQTMTPASSPFIQNRNQNSLIAAHFSIQIHTNSKTQDFLLPIKDIPATNRQKSPTNNKLTTFQPTLMGAAQKPSFEQKYTTLVIYLLQLISLNLAPQNWYKGAAYYPWTSTIKG